LGDRIKKTGSIPIWQEDESQGKLFASFHRE